MPDEVVNEVVTEEEKLLDTPTPLPTIPITDEEKEEFFKCFLADKPYIETLQLLGGKFRVMVRSLLIKENSDIIRQISLDQDKGIAKSNDAYFIKVYAYRLALAIVEINDVAFLPNITKESVKDDETAGLTYIYERAKPLMDWPEFKLSSLIDAYRKFESKVLELTNKVSDPTFWRADA
jgi:hypothetical protein